ncbi:N-acetyllactosaminide beta-1,3-N-acetylglucosaminyltransferase 3-like isoform X2 [Ambystoma mexicanum]|uniref:N-acetyllactosaminide beta-1,3-N-acetylglucosaminyltransferase 3-like isoform X2 n=1 Tax=Ambystoma mexicanum TaxID=8296 RepID=UPI0037E76EB2
MRRSCPHGVTVALTAVSTVILFYVLYQDPVVKPTIPTKTPEPIDLPSPIPVLKCKAKVRGVNATRFAQFPERVRDYFRYRHCKNFPRILDAPYKCGGAKASANVFLLLVIKSAPQNFDRREIIRTTWGAETEYQGLQVRRLFIIGVTSNLKDRSKMNKLVAVESNDYKDIIQWNFYDTFYNLTLKQVLFYEWLEGNCPSAQFLFNGDDDVFVHTFNVVQYLLGIKESKGLETHLFVGMLNIGMPLIRESWSKYYVPEEIIANDSFPAYCGGGGILMSGFTSRAIFQASQDIELIPIDDAYLGYCLQKAGLQPNSHEGVRTYGITLPNTDTFHPCFYKDQLVVHRFEPYEMKMMWNAIQKPNLQCGKNHILHKFYPIV